MATGGLVLRFQAGGLRYPAGAPGGRGGQFRAYGSGDGSRFLIELRDTHDKFTEANRTLARQAQVLVVDELKRGIKRRSVSTGRLVKVTDDPENIFADPFTWGVGDVDFLNESNAKYWRTIDEGSAAVWKKPFAGRFFYVNRSRAFGGTVAGYRGGKSAGSVIAGPPFTKAGAATGGILAPLKKSTVRRIIDENGAAPRWLGKVYIRNEIQAVNYYDRGFARLGGINQALRVYTNVIDQLWRGY